MTPSNTDGRALGDEKPGIHPIERLWREHGLPEYFLGNGGTNTKLYALYDAIRSPAPSGEKDAGRALGERQEGVDEIMKPYLGFINATPELLSLLYDIDMLPEQTVTRAGAIRLAAFCEVWQTARSPAPSGEMVREGCIICANGNDLPEGECCRACGREGSAGGLRAAVIKARGRQEPPTTPVKFARKADIVRVLKQHAKDIRAGVSGGDGSEPGWHAADVLDYVADNFHEIASRQPAALQSARGSEGE